MDWISIVAWSRRAESGGLLFAGAAGAAMKALGTAAGAKLRRAGGLRVGGEDLAALAAGAGMARGGTVGRTTGAGLVGGFGTTSGAELLRGA